MKTIQEVEQELLMKEERISYWESHGIILNDPDFIQPVIREVMT